MHPLSNDHVDCLGECDPSCFREMSVEQVIRAKDSIFSEMCEKLNLQNYEDIRAVNMAKKIVTRDMLVDWLETVCRVLNSFVVPLLESATTMSADYQNLKDEKITDQKSIIVLQNKLIEKNEAAITLMQTTAKNEIKSYSAAVTKTCSSVLTPKKIQAAVKKVSENNDRSKNLIIYGVKEEESEVLEQRVVEILGEVDEKPRVQDCCRIGLNKEQQCRPIKFSLSSHEHVTQVLRKSKMLRTKEGFKSVYICPDRSVEERRAFKKLLEELKKSRDAEPNKVFYIKNNKIVGFLRNSDPIENG